MAAGKTLNLLLVEDDLEDEALVREALTEIEEGQHWVHWSGCSLTQVDCLSDALDCLRDATYDCVLLNLSLPDGPNLLETFLSVSGCSPEAAIVVLADEDDRILASRMIREGAQDVILKSELDPMPLARSIRNAVDRNRRGAALESCVFRDTLTGNHNRAGFLYLGTHYLNLARQANQPVSFIVAEFADCAAREETDLLLIRATEVCRVIAAEATLIGRLQHSSLGLLMFGIAAPEARTMMARLGSDLTSAFPHATQPVFSLMQVDQASGESIQEILEAQKLASRFPVSCQVENSARRNVQLGPQPVRNRHVLAAINVRPDPEAA